MCLLYSHHTQNFYKKIKLHAFRLILVIKTRWSDRSEADVTNISKNEFCKYIDYRYRKKFAKIYQNLPKFIKICQNLSNLPKFVKIANICQKYPNLSKKYIFPS